MSACWNERAFRVRQRRLLGPASMGLVLGMAVYLIDRGGAHAQWLPAAMTPDGIHVFGAVGRWLPSLVHPFSFSLLTAAASPAAAASGYRGCAAWWGINVAFEVAQRPPLNGVVASGIDGNFGSSWLPRAVSNYLMNGTFDVADIVAATAGALAAAAVIHLTNRRLSPP